MSLLKASLETLTSLIFLGFWLYLVYKGYFEYVIVYCVYNMSFALAKIYLKDEGYV